MLDERRVRINLPPGIPRYYLMTFLYFLEWGRLKSVSISGDYIDIEVRGGSAAELLADGVKAAAEALRIYNARWKGVEVPASGKNDKNIFDSVLQNLCPQGSTSFHDALTAYSKRLISYKPQDLAAAFFHFGKGEFTLPSIFKPEHYALSRAPFTCGKEKYAAKLNLDFFMVLLAGYVLSRVGRVRVRVDEGKRNLTRRRGRSQRNRQVGRVRVDEGEWNTLHLFPCDLGPSISEHKKLIEIISTKEGWLPPGLRPEEAVMMWLAMAAPEGAGDAILVSMRDPGGMKAAEIGVAYHIPLSSFIARAGRALDKIKRDEKAAGMMRELLAKALNLKIGDRARDRAVELVKLLFLALQGSETRRAELLLRSSRIEAMKLLSEKGKDEEYRVVRLGRLLAEKIIRAG